MKLSPSSLGPPIASNKFKRTSGAIPALQMVIRRRSGKPNFWGKGRFGKRPPSITIERGGQSSNDNSNDSGFGWDSNSESQFSWGSTEDLRTLGRHSSAANTPSPPFRNSASEKYQGLIGKPELSRIIDTKPYIEQLHSASVWSTGKMSAVSAPNDMTTTLLPLESHGTLAQTSQPLPVPSNSFPVSPVPVKRSRFNFQTPAIPSKSGSGLKLRNQNQNSGEYTPSRNNSGKKIPGGGTPTLASALAPVSRDGSVQLLILAQPEEQHRARYQTEGSRGAIKDRKGNGFPAVQLIGYDKPTTLQIFIGSDQGKVSPHMFYQACKVSGKSSTPCNEKKVEGTMLIEIEFEPSKDMMISCDCVGILKERNVDVEQRFPFHHASSSRKKSTKCRLIFRTTIINSEGVEEVLLAASLPILCTQPPGQPEICKKSLSECSAEGREELFIIGKNFLKDTKVVFQEESTQGELLWEARAEIQKDYLQQNHLICVIPPYKNIHITSPVDCKLAVCSGGKMSEPNRFTYLPKFSAAHIIAVPTTAGSHVDTMDSCNAALQQGLTYSQPTTLAMSLPVTGVSVVQTEVESLIGNNMSCQESGNMTQVSGLAVALGAQGRRTSLNTAQTVSFDSALLNTTTMQQERNVVSELQSLLDQSSQQGLSDVNESKERDGINQSSHLNIGATSFLGQNLGENLVLGNMNYQGNTIPTTTQSMSLSLQLTNYPDINRQQQLSPTIQQFQNSEPGPLNCLMNSGVRDMMNMNNAPRDQQLLPISDAQSSMISGVQVTHTTGAMTTMATSDTGCVTTQTLMMKTEPVSPTHQMGAPTTQIQTPSSGAGMMNMMNHEIPHHEGGIANVLTEMTDNELLSYINPSCFDQVMKCC